MDLGAVGWIALQMAVSAFMVAVAAFARSAPMMALGLFAVIALAFLAIAGRSVLLSAGSARDTVGASA